MNTGHVYLVGAGPGDPGLITVRGAELLAAADVVVYDRLSAPELLALAPEGCELVNAGKNVGNHTLTQDETNALLVKHARSGKRVVRLKGGDPFLFGRGGEEAACCRAAGISFTIVPGVTSAFAVPAAAGIPVTYRGVAHHVTVVTASAGTDGAGDPDYSWLAQSDGTVVLLMGLRRTAHVAAQLMASGAPAARPAAVVSRGTTNQQQTLTGTLATIADLVEEATPPSPAIIVVGDVVDLHAELAWLEERPLFGTSVVVTRARAQASSLARELSELGASVVEAPTIQIEELPAPELSAALEDPARWDTVLLTSTNAAQRFFLELGAAGHDSRSLSGITVGAVGGATAAACRARGVEPDVVPARATGLDLRDALLGRGGLTGQRVLIPRGEVGDERLPEGLRDAGAEVVVVPVYRTVVEPLSVETVRAAREADFVTFSSASTVENFAGFVAPDDAPAAITIGPITTTAAEELGFRVVKEADDASIAGIVAAVLECVQTRGAAV